MIRLILLCLFLLTASFSAKAEVLHSQEYQAGQVWKFRHADKDKTALLKIGAIEEMPTGELVYHISIINVHYGPEDKPGPIGHLPVSKQTLDDSLIELTSSDEEFMDVTEGVDEWRKAEGGWFTITVSEIIEIIREAARGAQK